MNIRLVCTFAMASYYHAAYNILPFIPFTAAGFKKSTYILFTMQIYKFKF